MLLTHFYHENCICLIGIILRKRRKEGNVLFNDALNTLYLRLYGVRHMIKDHSDSEKGNPLPPHRLLFPINSKGSFICAPSHRQDSTYHRLCYTSRGALADTKKGNHRFMNAHNETNVVGTEYVFLVIV